MLELHVFGPAFDLPSIDPDCLAVILYLQNALPHESWKLIASVPSHNPFRQLPAVRDEDDLWIAGFDAITAHLRRSGYDLDAGLDQQQQADRDAYASFIISRGPPLLALSLYVSSDNYTNSTRRALGDVLPWPESWYVPHRLREQARRQSEHLGLSALDVDSAKQDDGYAQGVAAQIPKSLRKTRQTVSSLLGHPTRRARFRLDAVTADFFEPLQKQKGDKPWLLGDSLTSTDCLAIAYIALMYSPSLPQAWLKETLSGPYRALGTWARQHGSCGFDTCASTSEPSSTAAPGMTKALPWASAQSTTWLDRVSNAAEFLVSSLPGIQRGYQCQEIACPVDARERMLSYQNVRYRQNIYSQIVAASLGTATVVSYLIHIGVLTLPRGRSPSRSFGEAGALLGLH